ARVRPDLYFVYTRVSPLMWKRPPRKGSGAAGITWLRLGAERARVGDRAGTPIPADRAVLEVAARAARDVEEVGHGITQIRALPVQCLPTVLDGAVDELGAGVGRPVDRAAAREVVVAFSPGIGQNRSMSYRFAASNGFLPLLSAA